MKRWAVVTVLLYLAMLGVLVAGLVGVMSMTDGHDDIGGDLLEIFSIWPTWALVALFVLTQALLLVLPVRERHGKPIKKRHVLPTIITAGFLMALLVLLTLFMFLLGVFAESIPGYLTWTALALAVLSWGFWFFLFRGLFVRGDNTSGFMSTLTLTLYMGSILELLVAVTAHIITRRRGDCCAPGATAFGIAAGIAIALLSFGPGVFYLFAARRERKLAGRRGQEGKGS